MGEDEKEHIRLRLVDHFIENNPQVSSSSSPIHPSPFSL